MILKQKIKILTLFSIIILVISYSVYNEVTLKPFDFKEIESNIYRFQTYDTELNSAIVFSHSRYKLLENYDLINDYLLLLKERWLALKKISDSIEDETLHRLLIELDASLKVKSNLIKTFQEDNIILKITVLHFTDLLSRIVEATPETQATTPNLPDKSAQELTELTNTLYRDMLVYVNTSNPNLKISLHTTLEKLNALPDPSPDLVNGLFYANLILANDPKVEYLVKEIFNVKTMETLNKINAEFRSEFDIYLRQANINRLLLYLFSFILLCLLIWAFTQIRSTIRQLNSEVTEKQRAQENLRLVNQDLENRVKERTAQLTAKNKDLKKTLDQLQETQEQLVLQEKMASVGMLTSGIAHELKNPLNFVNNFSETSIDLIKDFKKELIDFYKNPSEPAKVSLSSLLNDFEVNSKKILEHGHRANNIVENMLLHSSLTQTSKEKTGINKLIEAQFDLAYYNYLSKNKDFKINLIKKLDPHVGSLDLVPQSMGRAILNIIMNAMYFLQKKEQLYPNVFVPEIILHTEKTATHIIIKIRDNGLGISAEHTLKIFEPFFTTKPTGEGTGLGLSITYDTIVKEQGGTLQVQSEKGEYTEFIIFLPCP